MTAESDDLLRRIRHYVHGRVPPEQEELITELVGRTVVTVMSDPNFYNHLVFVQQLQHEVYSLRQTLIAYQRAEQVRTQRARTKATAKKAPRAAPPKKAAPPRKAPTKRASTGRAFKRGASGG